MNAKNLLIKQALEHPEKTAIIYGESRISFSQLRDSSFKVANCLSKKGLSRGQKAAIFLPNTLENIYSVLGIFSLGATMVPMDFMLTQNEIIHFINHSQAKILIATPKKDI